MSIYFLQTIDKTELLFDCLTNYILSSSLVNLFLRIAYLIISNTQFKKAIPEYTIKIAKIIDELPDF